MWGHAETSTANSPKDAAFFRSKNIDLRPNGGAIYKKSRVPGFLFLEGNPGCWEFFFGGGEIPGAGIFFF